MKDRQKEEFIFGCSHKTTAKEKWISVAHLPVSDYVAILCATEAMHKDYLKHITLILLKIGLVLISSLHEEDECKQLMSFLLNSLVFTACHLRNTNSLTTHKYCMHGIVLFLIGNMDSYKVSSCSDTIDQIFRSVVGIKAFSKKIRGDAYNKARSNGNIFLFLNI